MRLPDLTQPTTQRGLVALITLLAARMPTEYRDQLVDLGLFIYSCMLMWTDESKRG